MFEPAMTFAVGEGWSTSRDTRYLWYLERRSPDPATGTVAVRRYSGSVAADWCSADYPAETAAATLAELLAWLEGHAGLLPSDPVEVTVGGSSAVQVVLGATAEARCPNWPSVILWRYDDDPGDPLPFDGLRPGDVMRVVFIERDAAVVVVTVRPGVGDGQGFLELVDEVLDTLTFG